MGRAGPGDPSAAPPVGEWAIHEPYPGYLGYQVEQRRRLFKEAGIELLPAAGAAFPLYKLLRNGGAVLLSLDAPGERRTEFLGAANASMAAVLGGTAREDEVARLARRHVAARARGWELTWRIWELERVPVRDPDRLHEARASGRGLMLSTHRRKVFHDAGIQLIYSTGCGMTLYKVLRRGGAVLMSMDMPGERRIRFLDKPVDMVDGTVQLATKTDALVLPVALMPLGRRWEIQIGEALDPRDFANPQELHLTLVSIHEKLIMAAPEHLENPLWRWPVATSEGWYQQ